MKIVLIILASALFAKGSEFKKNPVANVVNGEDLGGLLSAWGSCP